MRGGFKGSGERLAEAQTTSNNGVRRSGNEGEDIPVGKRNRSIGIASPGLGSGISLVDGVGAIRKDTDDGISTQSLDMRPGLHKLSRPSGVLNRHTHTVRCHTIFRHIEGVSASNGRDERSRSGGRTSDTHRGASGLGPNDGRTIGGNNRQVHRVKQHTSSLADGSNRVSNDRRRASGVLATDQGEKDDGVSPISSIIYKL